MQRRKFILGMGAVAAGGTAALGTGAFNFANVERDANMEVVDDSSAFLSLIDTSPYADSSDDALSLTFNDEADVGGTGINEDSDYSFRSVFRIRNRGSDSVGVWIEDDDSNDTVNWYAAPDFDTDIEGSGNAYALDPADTVDINVVILTRNNSDSLPQTVNIKADQSAGN